MASSGGSAIYAAAAGQNQPQESTIRLMTRLAIQHGAVNLSQGFPNEGPQYDMAWGGVAAIVGGTPEGMEYIDGVTVGDLVKEGEDGSLLTLKELLSRAAGQLDMFNQYSFPMGTAELRDAISDYTARFYGEDFRPHPMEEITVCLGATEGFATSLRAICAPGDRVAWFQPFHELYPAQVAVWGLQGTVCTLTEDHASGVWHFDREEMRTKLCGTGVKAFLLNSPHNPTGKVFTAEELSFICQLCIDEDIILVTDEIYEHILFEPHEHICCATLPGMRERTVVVQSVSKTASATGWRIGWIISPPHITSKIRAVHDSIVIQAPTPLQKGVERFLRLPDEYFTKEIAASYLPKRQLLCDALAAVGFKLSVPEGAYYIFTQYRGVPALSKKDPLDAAMFMIQEIGVAPVPGDGFYQEGAFGDEYMRFTFVRSLGLLEEAAEKLKKLNNYDEDGNLKPEPVDAAL